MPLYDFQCADCGSVVERMRPVGSSPYFQDLCPCCGKPTEHRKRFTPPRLCFVKGEHKNSRPQGEYDPKHRTPIHHVDPDTYERADRRLFNREQKAARDVASEKRNRIVPDHDFRKVGSITMAEFLARQNETGSSEEAMDLDYWRSQGRIYDHEKKNVREE